MRLAEHSASSVHVTYWAEKNGETTLDDLEGIQAFRRDLQESYVAVVHSRPGDLGGLWQLTVEFVSSITLGDVAGFIAAGAAYDAIKEGAKQFVLRPFLQAYRQLRERNSASPPDIAVLRLVFGDSILVIHRLGPDSVVQNLESIMRALAREYPHMVLRSGETPFEIHIPVFADLSDDALCRFRVLLDVDETIEPHPETDYLRLWGLVYDYSQKQKRVYEPSRRLLIDAEFLTREEYDVRWSERFARRGE